MKETTSTFVNGGPNPEKIDFEFSEKTQKTGKFYVIASIKSIYSYPDTLRLLQESCICLRKSLPYCGYLEDNYNRRYGWSRMGRSHAIRITSTGV